MSGARGSDSLLVVSAGNMQAYQIATAAPTTTLPQGVVMATTGSSLATSPQQLTEEAQRKRELRLLKNRSVLTTRALKSTHNSQESSFQKKPITMRKVGYQVNAELLPTNQHSMTCGSCLF